MPSRSLRARARATMRGQAAPSYTELMPATRADRWWWGIYGANDTITAGSAQRASLLADRAYITGAKVDADWQTCQPTQNTFDWTSIQADMDDLRANGKIPRLSVSMSAKVDKNPTWATAGVATWVQNASNPNTTLTPSATTGTITMTAGTAEFASNNVGDAVEVRTGPSAGARVLITALVGPSPSTQATGTVLVAFADTNPNAAKSWVMGNYKIVPWDTTYLGRVHQYVRDAARVWRAYRTAPMTVNGVGGSSEMQMTKGNIEDVEFATGATDAQFSANMKTAWLDTAAVYWQEFGAHPEGGKMGAGTVVVVPGPLLLPGGGNAADDIIATLVSTYGKNLVLAHSGFSAEKGGYVDDVQRTYYGQCELGGLTEKPAATETDPAGELQRHFNNVVWPLDYRFVTMHADALGIHPNRWTQRPDLVRFWLDAAMRFARMRA